MTDRFVLEKHVTSDATSEGYLAFDNEHDRKIRLRRIKSTLPTEELASLQEMLKSAQSHIDLIENSSVLKYNDIGTDDEGVWVSLPYRNGVQIQGAGLLPMSIENFSQLATQCVEAFAAIHRQDIVHGALDTNSIHLVMPEMPGAPMDYFIRDLGMYDILRVVKNEVAMNNLPSQTTLLAPELFEGQPADATSDLYMLGQLFYYYLLGGHPFADLDSDSALSRHLKHELPLASDINNIIPVEIALWIDKLTQPSKQNRFQSAEEALAASPFAQAQSAVAATATTQVQSATAMNTVGATNTATSTQSQNVASGTTSKGSGSSNKLLYGILGLLSLCLVAGAALYLLRETEKPSDSSGSSNGAIETDEEESQANNKNTAESSPENSVSSAIIKPESYASVHGGTGAQNEAIVQVGLNPHGINIWTSARNKRTRQRKLPHHPTQIAGPDQGASFRSYIMFRVSDIIDADPNDSIVNVKSLQGANLELTIDKKPNAKVNTIKPLAYNPITSGKNSRESLYSLLGVMNNGVVGTVQDNTYTFKLKWQHSKTVTPAHLAMIVLTSDRTPGPGDVISFDTSSITLRVSK